MEPKFIEMAKTIFSSIDHYRESGRDDKFNIDSIAEYLQRQFLLQQTDCSKLLESLEQKLSREYAVRDFAIRSDAMVQQHRANERIDLLQKLIDEFKPIA